MTLNDLITALAAEDPWKVVRSGFKNPHSYRGYYEDLAFEPASNVTVGDMLAAATAALGETYTGWKGGEYTMLDYTDCWLSAEGHASGESIGPTLLRLMLADVSAADAEQPPPVDWAALRDRIAEGLAREDGWGYASRHTLRDMSPSTREHYDRLADQVLAALPAPADRVSIEHARVIVRRLAAHAVGFQDVLDDTDRGPWGRTVGADIAALRTALDELTVPPAQDGHTDEAQQPGGEAPCTCADAGDCFAPAGHYADCPQAVEAQQRDGLRATPAAKEAS